MAENIAGRVGRIVSGSLNALVDSIEGAAPEVIMEQALREIDSAIDDVRAELGKVSAAKHLANKRLGERNGEHDSLGEKVEVALTEGREDLAEAAVEAQLDIEAQMPVLEQTIVDCSDREKELEGFVAALQAKRHEMREELRRFSESRKAVEVDAAAGSGASSGNKVNKAIDDATSSFDRVLEKNAGIPGVGGASTKNAAQLAELEQITRENRVKERLAAIKSSRAAGEAG